MTTNEFLARTYKVDPELEKVYERIGCADRIKVGAFPNFPRPRAICKDGYSVSIQACYSCYCTPRITTKEDYDTVELGYPNMPDDLIMEYAEDYDEPMDSVYGYVPVEVVDKLLEKHGGIDVKNTLGVDE